MTDRTIRVGTRPSTMALVQAHRVANALRQLAPSASVEVVEVTTDGDRWTGPLAELGGKGAFVERLHAAQLGDEFDIGVHCLKDIPGDEPLPEGLAIAAYQPREDVHDALVTPHAATLDDLAAGSTVGTSSVRRTAQLTRRWPMLRPIPIRGNADTRLRKLDDSDFDALILAVAGLQRIGAGARITSVIPADQMLPAVGAGVIAITTRIGDSQATALAGRLDDPTTRRAATAERAMLAALAGNCYSPIAGHAIIEPDGNLRLRGAVYSPDGQTEYVATQWGTDPDRLGAEVSADLLAKGARALIDNARPDHTPS